jgi:hypothetical protein
MSNQTAEEWMKKTGIKTVVLDDGTKEWYRDGKLHRDDGPAIEYADGSKEWWHDDKLDRDDGPAIEQPNSIKKWYRNGNLHRDDGPAVENSDGSKEWWRAGKWLTEEVFDALRQSEQA